MLRLQLLGGFRAYTDGVDTATLANQPRRAALLTHLAIERDVPRERVIDLLWPDSPPERGRHSLNQGIYFLRRILGADWVELRGDRLVVAPWVSTDVQDLEAAAAAGDDDRVLSLYRGPLLAGKPLAATAEFDMWADGRRITIDRLHRRARRRRIAALAESDDSRGALECAAEWCNLDPLEDEAQHRYIELLAAAGHRTAALRQYQAYSRLLEEHELEPLNETVRLVQQLQQGAAATLPAPPQGRPLPPVTVAAAAPARRRLFDTRRGLLLLLAGVFMVNLVETTVETWLAPRLPIVAEFRLQTARAAHWFEGYVTFENHELTNRFAVIGYSISYFLFFPLLLLGVGVGLMRRAEIRPFRVFSLGVAVNYLISLPFFLFLPVVERWAYPDTGAMVLSDLWALHLIDIIRPISGIDNSFPSFHTSLTVLAISTAFLFRLPYRWTAAFVGSTVILATLVLGIHWVMDVVAGLATGVLATALAFSVDRRLTHSKSALSERPAAIGNYVAEPQLEPR